MYGTLLSAKTPTMLARNDKPGARGVDVTAACDQKRFSKFSRFAEKFRDDVALEHGFYSNYLPREALKAGRADPAKRREPKKRKMDL